MFKVGVIGISAHTEENLLPALKSLHNVSIVGLSSTNPDKLRRLQDEYKIPYTDSDWKKVVQHEQVEYVVVASNPSFHLEVAKECTSLEKPLFVDKPPVESTAMLEELLASNTNKTPIFVGYSFRHAEPYQLFLKTSRELGRPMVFKARYIANKPRTSLWNYNNVLKSLLYAVGIHPIEMATSLFGKVSHIHSHCIVLSEAKNLYYVSIVLEFISGEIAYIETGNASNHLMMEYEIFGESGYWGRLTDWYDMEFIKGENYNQLISPKETITYRYPPTVGGYFRTGYAAELKKFFESASQQTKTDADLEYSLEPYKIIDAIVNNCTKA